MNTLPTAQQAYDAATAYLNRPIVIPDEVILGISEAASKGRYEFELTALPTDWARISRSLKEAGYDVKTGVASPGEVSVFIVWDEPKPVA